MAEECLVTGIYKFQRDDYVAIASREACSQIRLTGPVGSNQDKSSYLDKIGKVDAVTPFGDVKVTFGRELKCALAPQYLVKVRNLFPGDLVKLVDDIRGDGNLKLENGQYYKSATEMFGHICLVLDNCVQNAGVIYVTLGEEYNNFSPFHLDFIARPLYGDFMARVKEYACIEPVSPCLADNLFTALQDSMQDLPDVLMFASSKSSPYVPGNLVKVSSDITEFIRWQLNASCRDAPDPSTKKFQGLQDYARSGLQHSAKEPFPTEQVVSLLGHGKVLHVNPDGDAIVEFSDGRAWCIRSSFLQLVEDTDEYIEGARPCSARTLSEGIDNLIRHAHCRGTKTETLLHAACFSGNMDLVKLMLEGDTGLECEDQNGNKPLHYAAHGNQPGVIKFLLGKGANINATNKHRNSALHFAVKEGFINCVLELTKHNLTLNANIQDDTGNTPLHVAIGRMYPEIVDELVKLRKVNFHLTNIYGLTILHMAALKGNAMVMEKILSTTSDLVNLKQKDHGYAALHFAAVSGHYDIVETLVEKTSCHVDLLTKHEETALLLAAKEGHWNIVEFLILSGARINQKDRHGNTALHISLTEVEGLSAKPTIMPSSLAMNAVETKLAAHGLNGVEDRLLLSGFLVRCGADIRCPNKAGISPFGLASHLKWPAMELLGYFSLERCDAESGKCKFCHEEPANLEFRPCGHCFYCGDCGFRMKRCLSCREFIKEKVSVSHSIPSNPNKEQIKLNKAKKPILGPEVYTMRQKPRGLCVIINNVDFRGSQKPRRGSEVDSRRMNALFTALHFDVRVYTNLRAEDMLNVLSRAAKMKEQEKADCLVVFLMSHGGKDVIYGVDNKDVHLLHEVYNLFNNDNCPALEGKPKLFFVQACRGWKGKSVKDDATDSVSGGTGSWPVLPEWSDMYFAYATIPEYVAFRDTYKGSWFISAIYSCSASMLLQLASMASCVKSRAR